MNYSKKNKLKKTTGENTKMNSIDNTGFKITQYFLKRGMKASNCANITHG